MDIQPVIQHWLVSVARAAGLEGADELDVHSGTPPTKAWDRVAVALGIGTEALAQYVADHFRLGLADLDHADPHAHRLLPGTVARRLQVVPLRFSERTLYVATANPVGMDAEREVSHISGRSVHFEVAPPAALAVAVARTYPQDHSPEHAIERLSAQAPESPLVLVVDDEEDVRLLLRRVLEKRKFRVREAADGPTALELLEGDEPFDLVTLDLKMDGMQGLEVLRRIRSRVHTAALPVVVATAADNPAVEVELFEAGADDFVVKPVDPPRFVLRIQAVLRRRSAAQDAFGAVVRGY